MITRLSSHFKKNRQNAEPSTGPLTSRIVRTTSFHFFPLEMQVTSIHPPGAYDHMSYRTKRSNILLWMFARRRGKLRSLGVISDRFGILSVIWNGYEINSPKGWIGLANYKCYFQNIEMISCNFMKEHVINIILFTFIWG